MKTLEKLTKFWENYKILGQLFTDSGKNDEKTREQLKPCLKKLKHFFGINQTMGIETLVHMCLFFESFTTIFIYNT